MIGVRSPVLIISNVLAPGYGLVRLSRRLVVVLFRRLASFVVSPISWDQTGGEDLCSYCRVRIGASPGPARKRNLRKLVAKKSNDLSGE